MFQKFTRYAPEFWKPQTLATMKPPSSWRPLSIEQLQQELVFSNKWALAGGFSIDHFLGQPTRTHEDIDIGILRPDLEEILNGINQNRVFLCSPPGSYLNWNGQKVPNSVYDIWVTDPNIEFWSYQILVYDIEKEFVLFKRNNEISWPKSKHTIIHNGICIINPMVTFLYKCSASNPQAKDYADIVKLIEGPSKSG